MSFQFTVPRIELYGCQLSNHGVTTLGYKLINILTLSIENILNF